MEHRIHAFGPFELDVFAGLLLKNGERVCIRPKTFELLTYLVENPRRVLTKDELLEALWPDSFVTSDTLVQSVIEIRKILGDDSKHPRFLETVPRRGYIFVGEVCSHPQEASSSQPQTQLDIQNFGFSISDSSGKKEKEAQKASLTGLALGANNTRAGLVAVIRPWVVSWRLPVLGLTAFLCLFLLLKNDTSGHKESEKPAPEIQSGCILVMPFEVQFDSTELNWMSRGIADMIGNGIWYSPKLSIVKYWRYLASENIDSLETPPGIRRSEAADIAGRLGAEFVITGSIVGIGKTIQIEVNLLKAQDLSLQLSLRSRASEPEGIFQAVDELCLKLLHALALDRDFQVPETADTASLSTRSLDAYRYYITGLENFYKGGENSTVKALSLLQQAISIDPNFSLAYFKLAETQEWSKFWGYTQGGSREFLLEAMDQAEHLPEKEKLLLQGMSALMIQGRPQDALSLWGKLEEMYPSYARESGIPVLQAEILMDLGRLKEVKEYVEPRLNSPFIRKNDKARLNFYLSSAYRHLGETEKAVHFAEVTTALSRGEIGPNHVSYLLHLSRTYLDAGRRKDALQILNQAGDLSENDAPNLTNAAWGYYMAGKDVEAFQLVEHALRTDRSYGNAYHLRGWLQMKRGNHLQAAQDFLQAYRLTDNVFGSPFDEIIDGDLAALYFAGVALARGGDQEQSKITFLKLINRCDELRREMLPETESAIRKIQTGLLMSLAFARLGELQKAQVVIPPEVAEYQDQYNVLNRQLARFYSLQGNTTKALDLLERGIRSGLKEFQHLYDNPDFDPIRNHPRFRRLLRSARLE